jgi:propionyl-CoA synthetase
MAAVDPQGLQNYKSEHARSLQPEYWAEIARRDFHWEKPFTQTLDYNFTRSKGKIFTKWFDGGRTNLCYNAVDRWAAKTPDKAGHPSTITSTRPWFTVTDPSTPHALIRSP